MSLPLYNRSQNRKNSLVARGMIVGTCYNPFPRTSGVNIDWVSSEIGGKAFEPHCRFSNDI